MSLSDARWHVIAESNFAWEREALDWLRSNLPDRDSWHVWTNFEFIDDAGKVNEVDALVLSPAGLFLVEIKSRPGVLRGDAHSWTWTTDGRSNTYDNPVLLADRKAKRLASLLKRQNAIIKARIQLPFVQPAIFLSSSSLSCQLEGRAKTATFQHGRPGTADDSGIVGALTGGTTNRGTTVVNTAHVPAIARGLAEAGIRPSNKHRQVGDYGVTKLIAEGESFQEWEASHVSINTVHRRVRIYTMASASSPAIRAARVRQAKREFEILEGIDHPCILKVRDYKETELGPALIFDHDPKAVRLDHLLQERGKTFSVSQRLQLVRGIAETLQYAHSKRLYHRALGPQSILVHDLDAGVMHVRLMNWQTASRNVGDLALPNTMHRRYQTAGTRHVENYVEDRGRIYLAPETTLADAAHGPNLDVFSLGCIAYYLFSGEPPAESEGELAEKLRVGQGLRLSDAMAGCGARQHDLIQFATCPDLATRYDSIQDFLDDLDTVEDELTAPQPEATVDPSIASVGGRLEGGFTVVKRVGRGSSSDVLLVRMGGSDEEHILKVACDIAHNDDMVAEGKVLAGLRHQNIVAYRDTLTIAGRTALLLKSAGAGTLADKLKLEGRLSLDLLRRFGEKLLEAVNHLEAEGVAHRDIKPENIGLAENRNGKPQLVLFDFSLCCTPPDNITAGTHPYLDPFLSMRSPPRWDLYAERFALAVTLYEMAVGKPPAWGDGHSAPAMLDVEASIESGVFDPAARQGFTAFFVKALKRNYKERFDNAEDMLRAWRAIFATRQTVRPGPASDRASAAAADAGFDAIAPSGAPPAPQRPYQVSERFTAFAGAPTMVAVPPGRFEMGAHPSDPDAQASEQPRRPIAIAHALAISVTPVTFAQWDACLADDGTRHRPADATWGRGERPLMNVSWHDAQDYVGWLSRKTGERYRLLTEAEWEYACWAGALQDERYPWGADPDFRQLRHHAWFSANAQLRTQPVGQLPDNAWGLQDMLGNVAEWVADAHHRDLSTVPADGSASAPNHRAASRVFKGGSWLDSARAVRPSARDHFNPDHRSYRVGFRVAMVLALGVAVDGKAADKPL